MKSWSQIEPLLRKIYLKNIPFASASYFHPYVQRALKNRGFFLKSASKYGTPQYILDEQLLLKRANLFRSAFQTRVKLFYAFKCNDLPRQIRLLKQSGFDADVASFFELQLALKLGFRRIIFTSPVKSDAELELALHNNDKVILNIDSLDELERICSLARKKVRISFRVRVGEWSKFGFTPDELSKAIGLKHKNLKWAGLHFHTSWNTSPQAYVDGISAIGKFLRQCPKGRLSSLTFIDIGGGFVPEGSASMFNDTAKGSLLKLASLDVEKRHEPVLEQLSNMDAFAKQISQAFDMHIRGLCPKVELWCEPGRFVASLPTSILLKVVRVTDKGIYTDGGINLVGSADFRFHFFPIVNLSRPSLNLVRSAIYGPLCDPDDLWGYSYYGNKCRKGDILAVLHQGAYTFSTAWRFIEPIAPYVSFSGNKLTLAKSEETFCQRYAGCK